MTNVPPLSALHLDLQPVVRLPVNGPDPFNTLVVVRETFIVGLGVDAQLRRTQWTIPTKFVLFEFDPRAKPPQHSSAGTIKSLQDVDGTRDSSDPATRVITALDSIDRGYFDSDGTWTLDVSVAAMCSDPDTRGLAKVTLSSWVLCYEPPKNSGRPHGHDPHPAPRRGPVGKPGGQPKHTQQ